jgi:precorrin-2 dehydrogenase/sirohydrochlorin ferrochelatase
MAWLPVTLRLDGLRCVVAGGGKVAERKTAALLEAGAGDVKIISPAVTPAIRAWAEQGTVLWLERDFADGDLVGAALAFAATNRRDVNERVSSEAARCGCLANVADDPDGSGFAIPAVVRRGKLTLTVATGGASPALARRIRGELEARYGPEYEAWLDLLAEARGVIRERVSDTELRQELHRELERWDVPAHLRRKAEAEADLPIGGIGRNAEADVPDSRTRPDEAIKPLRAALLDTLRRSPEIAALRQLRAELGLGTDLGSSGSTRPPGS